MMSCVGRDLTFVIIVESTNVTTNKSAEMPCFSHHIAFASFFESCEKKMETLKAVG